MKKGLARIAEYFKELSRKLLQIDDTPQKIALGMGLGVFLGVLPGTGPIASLVLASFLRVNRASALLGSLFTNTWISVAAFLASIKVGSWVLGLDGRDVSRQWDSVIKDFKWSNAFSILESKVMFPIFIGFFLVTLAFSVLAYLLTLILVTRMKSSATADQP